MSTQFHYGSPAYCCNRVRAVRQLTVPDLVTLRSRPPSPSVTG
ncbi:hypothetical protein ATKI12_4468 [Kitasatospora sp. Ki12]